MKFLWDRSTAAPLLAETVGLSIDTETRARARARTS